MIHASVLGKKVNKVVFELATVVALYDLWITEKAEDRRKLLNDVNG